MGGSGGGAGGTPGTPVPLRVSPVRSHRYHDMSPPHPEVEAGTSYPAAPRVALSPEGQGTRYRASDLL